MPSQELGDRSWKLGILAAALIVVDQISKNFVPENLIVKNSGLPFAIKLPGFFNLAAVVILLLLFLILYFYFFRHAGFGFVFITAGTVSNLADRIYFGYVRDFINVGIATMNLADIMIWLGIILLLKKHASQSL